jgi:hypothetical protein
MLAEGDLPQAEAMAGQSLELSQKIGTRIDTGLARTFLGEFARVRGNRALALRLHTEALDDALALQSPWNTAGSLERLSRLALDGGDPERAAQVLGAASAMRERYACAVPPISALELQRSITTLKAELSPSAFERAWTLGEGLALEEVRRLATAA